MPLPERLRWLPRARVRGDGKLSRGRSRVRMAAVAAHGRLRMTLPESPLSLWLAEYGPYAPSPALAGDVAVDVAIVGGGFQGLATAIALRRAAPALTIAVLEHEMVGYGASGRNGSFAMTVVGLGFATMARLRGRQFVRDAHAYMERAVDGLEALVRDHGLECDMIRPGFLRVATTPAHERRLRGEVELVRQLGIEGIMARAWGRAVSGGNDGQDTD